MPEPTYNLLTEPLFRVRTPTRDNLALSLSGTLAIFGAGDVEAFLGLQAHQSHAWHAFLVQLAGIAMHRAHESDLAHTEERWEAMLRSLTGGRDEPWCLVVPDLTRPAFLQPPVPEGSLEEFKKRVSFPDEIDVLVTSRNHDVKRARAANALAEHWAYALVSLQTMQGFSGRDNYGVARMNSGFGSRPGVGFVPGISLGARFRRDLELVLTEREKLVEGSYGYPEQGGRALLWLEAWDGKHSLRLEDCDPLFIEVCRRVRLVLTQGRISAFLTSTKTSRIAAEQTLGDTGDPWTPIARSEGKALTVSASGFSYDLTQQLVLGGDYRAGVAGRPHGNDREGLIFSAVALARGQGETNGLHERSLPIPSRIGHRLGHSDERDRLAALAKRRVERADTARRLVLKPALCALLQGGAERLDLRDDRPRRWTERLDREIDRVFFDQLWRDADLAYADADARWDATLRVLARSELEYAIASVPLPTTRRYRAIAAAERLFNGAWRKRFGPVGGQSTSSESH